MNWQTVATRVFMVASVAFGVLGLTLIILGENDNSSINQLLFRLIFACVFIILSSFALSIAGKYLLKK